ncbi:MAG: hypothetical protein F6K58_08500 [Symploca sp. SIO2E9]|nr:hypothetical protein [Symploca sp. SIO2E9]
MEQRFLDSQTLAEIIASPPHQLQNIQAELLFIGDTYVFHYREKDQDVYKCLSPDSLRQAFNNQPLDSGWLPANVIRHGSNHNGQWSLMFIPAKRHTLSFEREQLQIPLPPLVFMGMGKTYWLWAIKSTTFDPTAKVFHAPLPNVNIYPPGQICWGSNNPPTASPPQINQAWTLFINSQFSNHYAERKSQQFPSNITKQLQQLHAKVRVSKRCRYPCRDLVPIGNRGETLEQLLEGILLP